MIKKAKGCAFGLLLGSLIRTISVILSILAKIIAKLLIVFGLWVPFVYAIFGLFLYLAFDFNPFDMSLYGTLYLSGMVGCILCGLVIAVRNLIFKPAKSVYEGYKHPIWERNRAERMEQEREEAEVTKWELYKRRKREERFSPPLIEEYDEAEQQEKRLPKRVRPYPVEYLPQSDDFTYLKEEEVIAKKSAPAADWLPKREKRLPTSKKEEKGQREMPAGRYNAYEPIPGWASAGDYPARDERYTDRCVPSRNERYPEDYRTERYAEAYSGNRDRYAEDYAAPSREWYTEQCPAPRKKRYTDDYAVLRNKRYAEEPAYEVSTVRSVPRVESPTIYFSKLEPDILVHEYSDRFELYRLKNNRPVIERVEYK